MLIVEYDLNDAYDDKGNYDEFYDENNYDHFKFEVTERFRTRKFPIQLEAVQSRWNGSTGYKIVQNVDEIIDAIMSFSNDWIQLHSGRGGQLYFHTANHDVPTGFNIYAKPLKRQYD